MFIFSVIFPTFCIMMLLLRRWEEQKKKNLFKKSIYLPLSWNDTFDMMLWNLNFLLIVIDLPAFVLIRVCIPRQVEFCPFKIKGQNVSSVLCDRPLDS